MAPRLHSIGATMDLKAQMVALAIATSFGLTAQASADEAPFVRIRAVGDTMIGNAPTHELPKDFYFANVAGELHRGDIAFANHEGSLCDLETPSSKCSSQSQNCYAFRTPREYAQQFAEAGFTILNLANNHVLDFGTACADETKATIRNAGMTSIGLLSQSRSAGESPENLLDIASVVNFHGKRIAFIGFHFDDGRGRLVSMRETDSVAQLVAMLKRDNDIVVAYSHGGAEGPDKMETPVGTEFLYGENRGDVRRFARLVIDSGADLVLGSGPHVLRGMEIYRKRLIVYSLGNFANYAGFNIIGPAGLGAIVEAGLNEHGELVVGQVISTYQHQVGTAPVLDLDERQRSLKVMQALSEKDFPETHPAFSGLTFFPQN